MKDKKFAEFTRGVVGFIHKKRGYDPHDADDDSGKKETAPIIS